MSDKIEFEASSGNVFADLELDDAETIQAHARIGFYVMELLKIKEYETRRYC